MKDDFNRLIQVSVENQEQAIGLMEKLFEAAKPSAVYSEPVAAEGHTVITASEVTVGLGFGYGSGGGWGPTTPADENETAPEETELKESDQEFKGMGIGGGGGGGGGAGSRPVAVIIIDKENVRVEPVMDVTKVALAFFTMLGSIFLMGSKIRKAANR